MPSAPFSFLYNNSPSIKQGIKTGLAGLITYVIYIRWHMPQGYWAVFTALVVIQVTSGASWKPALYRTIGSTAGALGAILLMMIFGMGSVRIGIELFLLGSLFGFLTVQHPSFSAAGFTAAIVLVLGRIEGSPFHIGWLRVFYTILGSAVAFAVAALIWPVQAREVLREKLATILEGSATLYQAVTSAALRGTANEQEIADLNRQLHDLRRGITQQLDEARNEFVFNRFNFSRFNQGPYQALIEQSDQIRRRLTAMAEDSSLYVRAQIPELVPCLPKLAERTSASFIAIAAAIRTGKNLPSSADLDDVIRELDADLARLRAERTTSPFSLDRMLPFWGFVFNLREVAQDLRQLESILPQLNV
jgi:uncharacterized membrane protein YccC